MASEQLFLSLIAKIPDDCVRQRHTEHRCLKLGEMNPSLITPPEFLFHGVEQDQRKWKDISWARTWKSHWITVHRHKITCAFLSRAIPSMPVGWT